MSAFREEDEHLFFGRKEFVKQLIEAVKQHPLVPVIGASGSGKSSVVFAGLIPRLRAEKTWLIESFRPENQPFYKLASALVRLLKPELDEIQQPGRAAELAGEMNQGKLMLSEVVASILERNPGKRILLVIDQFEELYKPDVKEEEQHKFLNQILNAVKKQHNFTLILTLRDDFISFARLYQPFAEAWSKSDQKWLEMMNRKELKDVIEKPAENRVEIQAGLTERILKAVDQKSGNLPLLEFALTQLWKKRLDGKLTHQAYKEIGGVENALAKHAQQQYATLNKEEKRQAKQIFIQLVYPGKGTENTRRLATISEVGNDNWDVVTKLANARLVITGTRTLDRNFTANLKKSNSAPEEREQTVEVIHETLITKWERLKKWIDNDREFRTWQERLRANMSQWIISKKDQGALLRGFPLNEALDWYKKRRNYLTDLDELQYIKISLQVFKSQEARRKKKEFELHTISDKNKTLTEAKQQAEAQLTEAKQEKKRIITQAEAQLTEAKQEKERIITQAEAQLTEAQQQAEAQLTEAQQQAEAQLTEAQQQAETQLTEAQQQAETQLTEAQQEKKHIIIQAEQEKKKIIRSGFSGLAVIVVVASTVVGAAWKGLTEAQKGTDLEQQSNSIIRQFPNNQIQGLLSAIQAGEQLQEQVKDNRLLEQYPTTRPISVLREILDKIHEKNTFNTNQEIVKSLSFSPDSKYIATAGQDGTLRLWNLSGKQIIKPIKAHDDTINGANSVSFSSDGKTIATSGEDGKIKIWDLFGNLKITLLEKEGGVKSVSFSPDNKKVATAGDYGIARIWDLSTKSSVQLKGYKVIKINSITFSPDGKTIATAGDDGTVRFSDLSGKPVGSIITPHNGKPVYHVSFSPNEQLLATAGEDNVARIWNLSGQEQKKLEGHQGLVTFVSFSPDGKRLVTTSEDGTVRVWDFLSGQEIYRFKGHERKVLSASFSPDGQYLASAGKDGKTRIWNLSDRQKTQTTQFKGHQSDVNTLSISLDGTRMASGDNNGFVRLWDLSTNKQIGKEFKADNRGRVLSITFSPDRKFLISGGEEGIAKIWDLSGRLIRQLKEKQGNSFISSLSFSSDGKYIAIAGSNQTPKIWSWDGEKIAKKIAMLEGHKDLVYQVSFHPKQELIATGAWDGTIGLWKLSDNKVNKIKIWSGHQGKIRSLSFSYDGKYLATADDNSELKVWDLSGQKKLELFSYQREIQAVAFSPDGKYIATGGKDGTVKLWDWLGRQVFEFKIEKGSVWDISFSADGRSIVAGGDSGQLQSWPVKDLDQLLAEGCDWLKGYLENSGQTKDKLEVCRNKDSNPK